MRPGQYFRKYGFESQWTCGHKKPSQLQPLRKVSDDPADAVVRHYSTGSTRGLTGAALLEQILADSVGDEECASPASLFLREVLKTPAWVDWKRISNGQLFMRRHFVEIANALLYMSLIGGFAAPKINKVLNSTGYLSAESPAAVVKRLYETSQMHFKCSFDGSLSVDEDGDLAEGLHNVLSVRLLHTAVRLRLLDTVGQPGGWNTDDWGVPINQEDMIVTQLAFSILALIGLERIGIQYDWQDMADFLHLWKLIGYYVGIKDEYNDHMDTVESAKAMLESIAIHLVSPNDITVGMVTRVLQACHIRMGSMSSMVHADLVHAFTGPQLSHALGLQPKVRTQLAIQHAGMNFLQRALHLWLSSKSVIRLLRVWSKLVRIPVLGAILYWLIMFIVHIRLRRMLNGDGKYALKRVPRPDLLPEREQGLTAVTAMSKCPF